MSMGDVMGDVYNTEFGMRRKTALVTEHSEPFAFLSEPKRWTRLVVVLYLGKKKKINALGGTADYKRDRTLPPLITLLAH